MEMNMKKEKHSGDKLSEQTLHEILVDIKYSLNHLEDIEADNRAIIVKLVKQNNTIVNYLKQLEIEVVEDYEDVLQSPLSKEEEKNIKKFESLKVLLEEFMSKRDELKEFEEELQKHKDELTPGTIGES
jgi:hypothetical protein|tara:strand:- start:478 stop:864 length:387 start_codon:yes stop_codon:yes gene_type:complete